MSIIKYSVQRLDGYTNGRESWIKVFMGALHTEEHARSAIEQLRREYPKSKFRVRRVTKK